MFVLFNNYGAIALFTTLEKAIDFAKKHEGVPPKGKFKNGNDMLHGEGWYHESRSAGVLGIVEKEVDPTTEIIHA